MARLLPRAAPAVKVFFLLSGYQNRLSIRGVYSKEFLLDGIRAVTPQQFVMYVVGALLIGVVESLAKAFGLADFSDVISFALLIIILVIKPTGPFGE